MYNELATACCVLASIGVHGDDIKLAPRYAMH